MALFTGAIFGQNNLLTGIIAPDITYLGNVNNINITCVSAGPGSAAGFAAALALHSDHELVLCSWSGASFFLEPGESLSFTFDVEIQPQSDLVFNAYFILPPLPSLDPDASAMGDIFGSGSDILGPFAQSGINNFSVAEFPVPVLPQAPGPGPGPGETIPAPQDSSMLPITGTGLYVALGAALLISIGALLVLISRTRRFNYTRY